MLSRVNSGQYPTPSLFVTDLRTIAMAAEQRWGEDPSYVRDLSDAHALVDEGMRALDALPLEMVKHCEEVEAKGGVEGQRAVDLATGIATAGARIPPDKHTR